MRRFVVGDIHGCYDELKDLLEKVKFSESDILYGVGDYCDRGKQNLDVLRFLMSLPNFVGVIGNHDIWPYQYLEADLYDKRLSRDVEQAWYYNGGGFTLKEFRDLDTFEKIKIKNWYGNLKFQIDLEDVVIIHTASPNTQSDKYKNLDLKTMLSENLCEKDYDSFVWDRSLDNCVFSSEKNHKKDLDYFRKLWNKDKWTIYGHTPHVSDGPYYNNEFQLINIDCGAFAKIEEYDVSNNGQLAIINLDTFEWFKSDGSEGEFSNSKNLSFYFSNVDKL